jgi:beta-glucosidase
MDYVARAQSLVTQMTVEEKALLLSGDGWWMTHSIDRLNIPAIYMTDGPHGLRKAQGPDLAASVQATCFPTAAALAASWNTDLLRRVGVALAAECQANDVHILLGPAVNMKRSPLGGRNFEYFSEDPLLAGKLATAYIQGVQSQGVGTSLKHLAVNNQEFERMAMSANVDERTLHEMYLPAFESAVKEAQPWSVMCAYNKLNGTYASENQVLLHDILRQQWGFQGFVVSDWGAVHDRVRGVNAGLHLEMPGSGDFNRKKIIQAVNDGRISEARLDEIVTQLLAIVLKAKDHHQPGATFDAEQHHALARQAAEESIVLLKNTDNILPLNVHEQKIALIGAFARQPRYQGAGSSQVNPLRMSTAYDELLQVAGNAMPFSYAQGYAEDGTTTTQWLEAAQRQARGADVAVVFAGLPDSYESEGFDRASLEMPAGHNRLIEAVAAAQPNLVVVLMNGAAVTMPWVDRAKAVVEAWLGGQAGGGALADVLTGRVNPSGKLAETFPIRLEDTPAYPEFPGQNGKADYGEGVFTGYRYYDKRKVTPLFPFGFGLSYTTFAYSDMRLSAASVQDTEGVTVEVQVKNTGKVAGKEIVQVYVGEQQARVVRPDKELKAFAKIALDPGEAKTVRFALSPRDFSYYDTSLHAWAVHPGKFDILIGSSSQHLPLQKTIEIASTHTVYPQLTRDSMLKEFRDHPKGKAFYPQLLHAVDFGLTDETQEKSIQRSPAEETAKRKADMAVMAFLNDMPVYKLSAFSQGKFTEQMLAAILQQVQ